MKKEVSNSMSIENDPHFDIITPICKVCKNFEEGFKCKVYGDRPKEYGYAKKYDCPKRDIDKSSYWYNNIKDKLN